MDRRHSGRERNRWRQNATNSSGSHGRNVSQRTAPLWRPLRAGTSSGTIIRTSGLRTPRCRFAGIHQAPRLFPCCALAEARSEVKHGAFDRHDSRQSSRCPSTASVRVRSANAAVSSARSAARLSSSNFPGVPYFATCFDRSPDQSPADVDGTYTPAHSLQAVSGECTSGQP
jgi:hypothetical protein